MYVTVTSRTLQRQRNLLLLSSTELLVVIFRMWGALPLSSSLFLLHQQYSVILDPSRPEPHDILVPEKSNNVWNSLICDT